MGRHASACSWWPHAAARPSCRQQHAAIEHRARYRLPLRLNVAVRARHNQVAIRFWYISDPSTLAVSSHGSPDTAARSSRVKVAHTSPTLGAGVGGSSLKICSLLERLFSLTTVHAQLSRLTLPGAPLEMPCHRRACPHLASPYCRWSLSLLFLSAYPDAPRKDCGSLRGGGGFGKGGAGEGGSERFVQRYNRETSLLRGVLPGATARRGARPRRRHIGDWLLGLLRMCERGTRARTLCSGWEDRFWEQGRGAFFRGVRTSTGGESGRLNRLRQACHRCTSTRVVFLSRWWPSGSTVACSCSTTSLRKRRTRTAVHPGSGWGGKRSSIGSTAAVCLRSRFSVGRT